MAVVIAIAYLNAGPDRIGTSFVKANRVTLTFLVAAHLAWATRPAVRLGTVNP